MSAAWRQARVKVWFTADLHLGNPTAIGRLGRPFRSVEQMDKAIINRWNERVGIDDVVWVLGGVGAPTLLGQFNGRKYLVAGDRDALFCANSGGVEADREHFTAVVTGSGIRRSGHAVRLPLLGGPLLGHPTVLVSPFPYVADGNAGPFAAPRPPKKGPRTWLLHGDAPWAVDPAGRQVNVSADAWDFAPVGADEVAALIEGFDEDVAERQLAEMTAAAGARETRK
jgi:calcineurin-like phosphoesterase family protein